MSGHLHQLQKVLRETTGFLVLGVSERPMADAAGVLGAAEASGFRSEAARIGKDTSGWRQTLPVNAASCI